MIYIPFINNLFRVFELNKKDRLHYYPSKISIETGNICNLRCPLCPTNDKANAHVVKGSMTLDDFKKIFSKIKPFVRTIDLFNWGEPFLNKDIGHFIKHIKENKPMVRVLIDSNFNIVQEDQIDQIVRYGLDRINISCDGATQEVYEKYRVGGNLENVLQNIRKIVEKKKKIGVIKPQIIWKYLVFKHNEHEVELARQKAQDLGVEFSVSGMRIDCGKEIFEELQSSVDRDREWIPDDPHYNNYQDLTRRRKFCPKPWKTMTINWNGDVVPCGALYDCSGYSYGNLLEQEVDELWNGSRYIQARRIILGQLEKGNVICSLCKKKGYQYF